MGYENISSTLDELFDSYESKVYALAEQMFTEHIEPILVRNRWGFHAGMGSWVVSDESGETVDVTDSTSEAYDGDMKILDEILCLSVPGFPANDLGSMMPEFEFSWSDGKTDPLSSEGK